MSFSNQGRFRQQVVFCGVSFCRTAICRSPTSLGADCRASIDSSWMSSGSIGSIRRWSRCGSSSGQVLSQDHSCRAAVARLIAHRVSRGQRPCSAETGAYCQARKRLPEEFFSEVARKTGQCVGQQAPKSGGFGNVAAFWPTMVRPSRCPILRRTNRLIRNLRNSKPGVGFPLARMAAFFSLSCGAVLDLAICSYSGKGHSELGMLRKLWDLLRPGDIMLADRYMCAWHEIFCSSSVGSTRSLVSSLPSSRLQARQAFGQRRSHCRVAQAPDAFARSTGKPQITSRATHDSRDTRASPAAWIPQPQHDRCHHVVGRRGGDRQRSGRSLSRPLERRTRSAVAQANDADGHLALQDARAGAEGNLDAHPGLQSHPHDHRASGQQTRYRATNDQLQRSDPNTGSVSTADCHSRRTRLNAPPKPLPTAARRCRNSSRCRPPRSL